MTDTTVSRVEATPLAATTRGELPGSVRLGLVRGRGEVRVFFRNRAAVIFTVALPLALMLLFGSLFKASSPGQTTRVHDVIVAGVLASGLMSAGFGGMAFGIALESGDGTIRRLQGTPFTTLAYFVAKAILVVTLAFVQTLLVVGVAMAAFGFSMPSQPGRWFTFCWVFILGCLSTSFLGVALGSVVTDRRSIAAVVQFPFVLLQFISGVYYAFSSLPGVLQHIGALFPLKWMAQGMRGALLPDSLASAEPAHAWELGRVALVLGAWTLGGLLICVSAQRIQSRRDAR